MATEKKSTVPSASPAPQSSPLNPVLFNRPIFPSIQRMGELGQAALNAFTPAAGTPPPTMAGVSVPPAGSSFSQLQFRGPLINRPYGEPSVRPDFRNPAEQWDAKPVSAGTAGMTSWPVFRGTQRTAEQIAEDEAYFDRRNPQISRAIMSPQTLGVVDVFRGNAGAINAQYTPTLPQTTLSKYSIPTTTATQLGIGMGSQIAQANAPATFGAVQPMQQLPSIQQQIPFQKTAIQTPSGTVYATSEAPRGQMTQAQIFASRPTSYEGRTPEQQQALLAQMRQRGAAMAKAGSQEQFFAQKRAERSGLAQAEAAARAGGASSMDILRARDLAAGPSTIGAIRRQANQYSQRLPMQGLATKGVSEFNRNLTISQPTITGLGASGYALYNQQQAAKLASGGYNTPQGFRISTLGTAYPSSSRRTRAIDNRYTQAGSV